MYKEFNKINTVAIPYCTEFHDALSDGKVLKFIERNMDAEEGDENYKFISAIKKVASMLLQKAQEERIV